MSVTVNVVGRYDDKEINRAISGMEKLRRTSSDTSASTAKGTAGMAALAGGVAGAVQAAATKMIDMLEVAGQKVVEFAQESVTAYEDLGAQTRQVQRVMGGSSEFASSMISAWKMTGVGVDVASMALSRLEKHAAANDKQWRMLGVAAKDAHGNFLPMERILPKIMDRFASMPNGVAKTALAMQLFGSRGGGAAMIAFLNKGSAGLKQLRDESDKLGTTLSGKDTAATLAATLAKRKLGEAVEGLQIQLGRYLYPAVTKVLGWLVDKGIPALQSMADTVNTTVVPAIQNLVNEFTQNLQPAIETFSGLWNGDVKNALVQTQPILGWIVNFIGDDLARVVNTFAALGASAVRTVIDLVNVVGVTVVGQVNNVISAFNQMAAAYNATIGALTGSSISAMALWSWTMVGGSGPVGAEGEHSGSRVERPSSTPAAAARTVTAWTPNFNPSSASGGGGGGHSGSTAAAKKTMAQIMSEALSGAQKVLDKFVAKGQAVLDFINGIKASVVSFGAVTAFQSRGNLEQANSTNIVGQMGERVRTAQRFAADVRKLRLLGLNNSSLQEIIAAGPRDGDAIAQALLQGGLGSVRQVNSLEAQLNAAGYALGEQGSLSQYGMTGAQARAMATTNIRIERGALQVSVATGSDPKTAHMVEHAVEVAFARLVRELRSR